MGAFSISKVTMFPGDYEAITVSLDEGTHTFKRLKSSTGRTCVLRGILLSPGNKLLPPPAPYPLRIEVIGDSHSEGWGLEVGDWFAYPGVLARALGADLSLLAWSAHGVTANHGNEAAEPTIFPEMFVRTGNFRVRDLEAARGSMVGPCGRTYINRREFLMESRVENLRSPFAFSTATASGHFHAG